MKGSLLLSLFVCGFLCVASQVIYVEWIYYQNQTSNVIQQVDYFLAGCIYNEYLKSYQNYTCTETDIMSYEYCNEDCSRCNGTTSYEYGREGDFALTCMQSIPKIPSSSVVQAHYNETGCSGAALSLTALNPNYCIDSEYIGTLNYYCNNTVPYINRCSDNNCSKNCTATPLPDWCMGDYFTNQCGYSKQ
eukprot:TRINITY_DN1554_c0_g1_i1.p1 TRINITY_DN1554_c0_g1~~TRINITY_DN1554_c0_g1_i1.p1  ORF type:complete len:190 (+),score=3.34 TRINITY_DN1554_c0_g1_i1:242-811(+)